MVMPAATNSMHGNRIIKKDKNGNKYIENPITGEIKPTGSNPIDKYLFGDNGGFYVGYNSNTGFNASMGPISIGNGGISVNPYTGNGYTQQPQINKPVAYTANAAKTANSIAQGGMTKQEIQDFNTKHPNESAWRQS